MSGAENAVFLLYVVVFAGKTGIVICQKEGADLDGWKARGDFIYRDSETAGYFLKLLCNEREAARRSSFAGKVSDHKPHGVTLGRRESNSA